MIRARELAFGAVACFAVVPACVAPPMVVNHPGSSVQVHDIAALPWLELSPGLRVKAVVGERSTFALAELDPAFATNPHHHTHEQYNVGVAGTLEIIIGGSPGELRSGVATLAHSDVRHSIANRGPTPGTMIEFQPVRRLDLVAPRQPVSFPSSAEANDVPPGKRNRLHFAPEDSGWRTSSTGATYTALPADRSTLTVWRLSPSSRQGQDLRRHWEGEEQLLYVLSGSAEVRAGSEVGKAPAGTLIVIAPAAGSVSVGAVGDESVTLIEFIPAPDTNRTRQCC